MYKDQLYFHTLAMNNWELKFKNNLYNNMKEQEILRDKSDKRCARPIHQRLQKLLREIKGGI